ncbi:MAG: XdhC family protein [Burkholderiaceae bacterium]|nr:XdhC family protein [Burkholderiaceae bacterium]
MSTSDVLTLAHRLQTEQQPFALVSVLRVQAPASAQAGDKAVVTADGIAAGWIGGGCAQPAVMKTVRQALADGRARLLRISPAEEGQVRELGDVLEFGMACHSGGTLELFVDPVLPVAQLVVIGETPLAQALATLAPHVGLRTQAVTDEATAQIPPGAFVVVATQGRRDLQGLRAALKSRPQQIFFVASARKGGVLKAALKEAGEDAAAVDAIVAPAGQPIGAQTPPEIALSVLAAVVAARRASTATTPPTPELGDGAASTAAAPKGRLSAWLERIPLPQIPESKGGCCS